MSTTTEVQTTARLEDWRVRRYEEDIGLIGRTYGDVRGRRDGKLVITSALATGEDELEEGGIAVTANSRYLLGRRAEH